MRVLVRSICALSVCFLFAVAAAKAGEDDCQRAGAQESSKQTTGAPIGMIASALAPNPFRAILPIRPRSAAFMS